MYLIAYNREHVLELIRTASPHQLRHELRTGKIGRQLDPDQREELDAILTAWEQRALGAMPLRDALLVDSQRGRRAFGLLCADLSVKHIALPPTPIGRRALPAGDLRDLPPDLADDPDLAAFAADAQCAGLTLAVQRRDDEFSLPSDLDVLLPPKPPPYNPVDFEPPRGLRRTVAVVLATSGMTLLGLPALFGRIPEHPAGLPLALITLALLVGIRAGKAGYAGSLCIWLVAQLPSFRHDTTASLIWPALPLLGAGLLLLSVDRRIRAMWAWIRRQVLGAPVSTKR
jgi:hypothetical protein